MLPYGDLYLVRPDSAEDESEDSFDGGKMLLEQALELLALAGCTEELQWLEALLDEIWERDRPVMSASEMTRFLETLEGLDERLIGTVVNPVGWTVKPEQLPELRARTKRIDVSKARGELAVHGVAEAMANVGSLRAYLRQGLDSGLLLAFAS